MTPEEMLRALADPERLAIARALALRPSPSNVPLGAANEDEEANWRTGVPVEV